MSYRCSVFLYASSIVALTSFSVQLCCSQEFEFSNDADRFEEAQEDDDFRSAADDLEQRHAEGVACMPEHIINVMPYC